jgi:hypothetical protein
MNTQRLEDLHLLFEQRGDMCAMPCCALDVLERTRNSETFRDPEGSDRPIPGPASSREISRTVTQ